MAEDKNMTKEEIEGSVEDESQLTEVAGGEASNWGDVTPSVDPLTPEPNKLTNNVPSLGDLTPPVNPDFPMVVK